MIQKTQNIFLKLFSICFILFLLVSCSDSNDPATQQYFVKHIKSKNYTKQYLADIINTFSPETADLLPDINISTDMITYNTFLPNGFPVVASGIVVYPNNSDIKGIIVGLHPTITAESMSPSTAMYSNELLLGAFGYAVIIPDYIGFGVTTDKPHPYLHVENTGIVSADMCLAAREYFKTIGKNIDSYPVSVVGYSQGGAAAIAFQKIVENRYPTINIRKVYAGGGPYDIPAILEEFRNTKHTALPSSLPYVVLGLNYGDNLNLNFNNIFLEPLLSNYKTWFNKNYTNDEIDKFIGSTDITTFMHPDLFKTELNEDLQKFYTSALNNSLVEGWIPKAPIFLAHGTADDIVPVVCSNNAYKTYKNKGCNVELKLVESKNHTEAALDFFTTTLFNIMFGDTK